MLRRWTEQRQQTRLLPAALPPLAAQGQGARLQLVALPPRAAALPSAECRHDHMLSNLCGNGNDRPDDVGKLNITFHHNWWGAGVRSRQPRVRYGQVHVFNNYYHYTPITGDGGHVGTVAAGQYAKLLVENNYFDGSTDPIYWQSDEGTAEVVERGNEFINTNGDRVTRGASFTPPYDYTMDRASEIKDIVTPGAGPR